MLLHVIIVIEVRVSLRRYSRISHATIRGSATGSHTARRRGVDAACERQKSCVDLLSLLWEFPRVQLRKVKREPHVKVHECCKTVEDRRTACKVKTRRQGIGFQATATYLFSQNADATEAVFENSLRYHRTIAGYDEEVHDIPLFRRASSLRL